MFNNSTMIFSSLIIQLLIAQLIVCHPKTNTSRSNIFTHNIIPTFEESKTILVDQSLFIPNEKNSTVILKTHYDDNISIESFNFIDFFKITLSVELPGKFIKFEKIDYDRQLEKYAFVLISSQYFIVFINQTPYRIIDPSHKYKKIEIRDCIHIYIDQFGGFGYNFNKNTKVDVKQCSNFYSYFEHKGLDLL